ncbi:MAG: methyltransferase domain-containing protein [Magnetococcales bacterium]|nr:methyltransferase domain-containing protein [Magnetococcales bacterium]
MNENAPHGAEKLYEVWDEHWSEEQKLTFVGRIFVPIRMRALQDAIDFLQHQKGIKSALDTGCGWGHLLGLFHAAKLDYMGIDVSLHSIAACKRKGFNAKVCKVEEETRQYDLVASEGMLEHFLDFEPFARHLMRLSTRYVLIMQPNHDTFLGRLLFSVTYLVRGDKIVWEYNYRMRDFIDCFDRHGFSVIRNQPLIMDTSRLLLFERRAGTQD